MNCWHTFFLFLVGGGVGGVNEKCYTFLSPSLTQSMLFGTYCWSCQCFCFLFLLFEIFLFTSERSSSQTVEQTKEFCNIYTQPNGVGLSLGVVIPFVCPSIHPSICYCLSLPSLLPKWWLKNEENRPCLTFLVDSKNDLEN